MAMAKWDLHCVTMGDKFRALGLEDISAVRVRSRGLEVILVSLYMRPEGKGPATMARFHALAAARTLMQTPWAIDDDWNLSPSDLERTGWLGVVHGQIVPSNKSAFT